jgi:hypothetical protein
MTLKLFRAVWFLSMLAVLVNLLYVYASLPEEVSLIEEGMEKFVIGRELIFYIAMIAIVVVNVMVYLFTKKLVPEEDFRIWLHGLVISLNIFIIIGMSFISLVNSAENYDFGRLGIIIYSSVGLVVLWALGWPIYVIGKKFLSKQTV